MVQTEKSSSELLGEDASSYDLRTALLLCTPSQNTFDSYLRPETPHKPVTS